MYMYICTRSVNYHNPWRKVIVLPYLTNGGKVYRLFETQKVEKLVQDYIASKWQRQDSNLGSLVPESTPLTTTPFSSHCVRTLYFCSGSLPWP